MGPYRLDPTHFVAPVEEFSRNEKAGKLHTFGPYNRLNVANPPVCVKPVRQRVSVPTAWRTHIHGDRYMAHLTIRSRTNFC